MIDIVDFKSIEIIDNLYRFNRICDNSFQVIYDKC